MLLSGMAACAQVSVSATSGTAGPTPYTTLKAAFDAINAGTHSGNVTLTISGNTTETAVAALNAGPYTSLTISATASATVSGTVSGGLITFNGSRNVSINGNNNLLVNNTSTSGAAVRFTNNASGVRIRQTRLRASFNTLDANGGIAGGVVFFDAGTSAGTGNSGNRISDCDIDGGSQGVCGIFSRGDATSATTQNRADTIQNCTIHDFLSVSVAAASGILLAAGNDRWVISGNSVYNTGNINTTQQMVWSGIQVFPNWTTDAHEVTGNFVGGNQPNANGNLIIGAAATNAVGFTGINIQTGGTGNTVANNTIRNVQLSYAASAGSFANAGIFAFIGGFSGTTTLSGNTISNITAANNNGSLFFYGIQTNGRATGTANVAPVFNLANNTVSNITATGAGTGDAVLYGVRLDVSSGNVSASVPTVSGRSNPVFNVNGNTITNLSVPYAGVNGSFIRAIGTVATQGTSATSLLHPRPVIVGNTISQLSTTSGRGTATANAQFAAGVLAGIHIAGSAGAAANTSDTNVIRQNTIFNLSAANSHDSNTVAIGILGTNGIYDVSRNRIYDIRNAASGATATPGIVGITLRSISGNSAVYNNFISLGNNVATNMPVFGILQNFSVTGSTLNVYHNSVQIMGTASGSRNSFAFFRGDPSAAAATIATSVNIRNNIFQNLRSGGTGRHAAIGNTNTSVPTAWVSAFNALFAANAAHTAVWGTNAHTLATYLSNSGDASSVSTQAVFADAPNADLHLTGASLSDANLFGTPIPSANTFLYGIDFDGAARSTSFPVKGADEVGINCAAPSFTVQPAAASVCAGANASFNAGSNDVGVVYQWLLNGNTIPGATNATYSINNVQAANAGNYSVRISTGCGSTVSNAVALTVNAATAIAAQPQPQAVCAGQNASFTVNASGSGTLTYQWRRGASDLPGATAATLNLSNVSAADAGSYTVVVTGSCGAVTSNAATLTVNAATAITTHPAALTVCAGQPATLSVTATGSGTLSYQWRKEGNNINGATNATFSIASTTVSDGGNYTVSVGGACGTVVSNAAALVVQTGGSCTPTSVSNVSEEITASLMLPSVVRNGSILRVHARRAMTINWLVTDAQGRVLRRFQQQLHAGQNDLQLALEGLSAGSYQVSGQPSRGGKISLRFVKL